MLLFMEKLYDMHCHVGFAPAPATVAAEGAQAGIGALSCTVEPTEYEPVSYTHLTLPTTSRV